MIPSNTSSKIEQYSAQLAGFLGDKYVDQALVQGFVTRVQAKFSSWIVEDLKEFEALFRDDSDNAQVDTAALALIDLLQMLWAKFHHPIVKFYQLQHAELLTSLAELLRKKTQPPKKEQPAKKGLPLKKKKLSGAPDKNKPQFKVVEMRKLNEAFVKVVSAAALFYSSIALHITETYSNPLIHKHFLDELGLAEVAGSAAKSLKYGLKKPEKHLLSQKICDLHSTLSYAIFNCLLNLGNLSRHIARIELSYVQPGKSISAYYKHLKSDGLDTNLAKKLYFKPLRYYSKCIGILPTIHEPYNHMGVIYHAMGEKFTAVIWFLRSQTTRDTASALGRHNLNTLLCNPWLEKLYKETTKKPVDTLSAPDVNNILMRIAADYFYPNSFGKLYTCKAESDLLEILFLRPQTSHIATNPSLVTDHITMLICFLAIAQSEQNPEVVSKFGNFTMKYFEKFQTYVIKTPKEALLLESVLQNLRLILAYLRKNSWLLSNRPEFVHALVDVLNQLADYDSEDEKRHILELFKTDNAPIRSYYFAEDVKFKDFTPIGCQFKDFNDEHLFKSNNIELLFGSHFYIATDGIPSFLDNNAVQRINKEMELDEGNDQAERRMAISNECARYENVMRINAIVAMARKVLGHQVFVKDDKIVVDKSEMPMTQTSMPLPNRKIKTKPMKKKNSRKGQEKPIAKASTQSSIDEALVPSTFQEIEEMIIGHAPTLLTKKTGSEMGPHLSLVDMVDSIVSEDVKRSPSEVSGNVLGKLKHRAEVRAEEGGCMNFSGTSNEMHANLQPKYILHPPQNEQFSAQGMDKTRYSAQDVHPQGYTPAWVGYTPGQYPPAQMQVPMMPMPMGYYPQHSYPMAPNLPITPFASAGQMPPPESHMTYTYPFIPPGGQAHASPNVNNFGGVPTSFGQDQSELWRNGHKRNGGPENMYPQYQ